MKTLLLALLLTTPAWGQSYPVYSHPDNPSQVRDAVEHAIYHWNRFSTIRLYYAGVSSLDMPGTVLLRTAEPWDFKGVWAGGDTQRWYYLDSGIVHKAVIRLNTLFLSGVFDACDMHVLIHEFGHVYGAGHSDKESAVMFPYARYCQSAVTPADVALLPPNTRKPYTCEGQISRHGDLYLPYVNGFEAYLEQRDGVWVVAGAVKAEQTLKDCAAVSTSGELHVPRALSPVWDLTLDMVHEGGPQWRLVNAQ